MNYAVIENNRTIALFRRLRDANALICELNWEGTLHLRVRKIS